MNLRSKQKEALNDILSGKDGEDSSGDGTLGFDWKVLVLDQTCRDVLAPLMSVNELRRLGVTLHLAIDADRDALQDALAVYLCRPVVDNVTRIARDCEAKLYGRFQINFSSRVDRRMLETMARSVATARPPLHADDGGEPIEPPGSRIVSVWDRNLQFVALEPRLFTLTGLPENTLTGVQGETVERIATGLACACSALMAGDDTALALPIIRCAPGRGAAAVGEALGSKLANAQALGGISSSTAALRTGGLRNFLVVIVDRHDDLLAPLRHAETYQAMVDDLLRGGLRANRVDVSGVSHELCVDGDDDFFAKFAQEPLPDVIDASSKQLAELREQEQRVRARTTASGGSPAPQASSSKDLMQAIDALPRLLKDKARLEEHTTILRAIMVEIAQRQVPQFIEAEQPGRFDKKLVRELLLAPFEVEGDETIKLACVYDRLRLLFVWGLDPNGHFSDEDIASLETDISAELNKVAVSDPEFAKGPDLLTRGLKALVLARNQLRQAKIDATTPGQQQAASVAPGAVLPEDGSTKTISRILATAQAGATKLVDKAAKGVSSLLSNKSGYIINVLEDLFESRGTINDTFLRIDPAANSRERQQRSEQPPADALVFIVGGGCYSEYHALQAKLSNSPRNVVYGATSIINGAAFFEQLISLGDDSAH